MKHTFIAILLVILCNSCDFSEGGVKTGPNMEKYALEYNAKNNLLEPGEKMLAYYDCTISLDGTEAAFVTNSRVVYHKQETQTTAFYLKDIVDIAHSREDYVGHLIEVTNTEGEIMMIEIAPLNQGELFLKVLRSKVK